MSSTLHGRLSENVIFDDDADVANIFGVNVSGEVLRALTEPTCPGVWMRVAEVKDGMALVQFRHEVEI